MHPSRSEGHSPSGLKTAGEKRSRSGRAIASVVLTGLHVGFACVHLFLPSFAYRPGVRPTTTAVVVYINDSFGPAWGALFAGTAFFLIASLVQWRRARWIAHLLGGGVFFFYDAALWAGVIVPPHGSVLLPITLLVIVVGHVLLTLSYGGDQ